MPAKARCRINEAGIYSHIYNRGIEERVIFKDEEDYKVFLSYLEDYLATPKDPESVKKVFKINGRTYRGTPHQPKNYFKKVELIAYSLMPNHFHLLLHQAASGAIENLIRALCTRYSMYFNKKYARRGPLFEGPYKSISINGDARTITYLTHYLHRVSTHSSCAEFFGLRETSWVKPQIVSSLFNNKTDGYKYFIGKYKLDEKENELIDGLIFKGDTDCSKRRDLTSSEGIDPDSVKKSPPKVLTFWGASVVVFLLLINLSIRNIQDSFIRLDQSLPIPIQSEQASQVLGTQEKPKETAQTPVKDDLEETSKVILTVKTEDASSYVNMRQEPSTDSVKIGKAYDGDKFEFVSKQEGWYEVRLGDRLTGFISEDYLVEEVND